MPTNPVLTTALEFTLPDFAAATAADYQEAFEGAMARQLAAIADLVADGSPATVATVLDALEDSGRELRRVANAFFTVHWSDATAELNEVATQFAPRLANHQDEIVLNRALFDRLIELRERIASGATPATAEQRYALSETIGSFRRAGVELDDAAQTRLRELNGRLAQLGVQFEELTKSARNASAVVATEQELAGLDAQELAALRTDDGFRIELINTTQQPLAAKLTDAGLRARLYRASVTRALAGEFDTRAVLLETARLRAERANLLGYPHHSALVAENGCAKSTEAVLEMLVPLAQAALAKARSEATQLSARYGELNPGAEFTAADWSFVEAIVRRERFDFDPAQVGQYLQIDAVLQAVFGAAEELYGLTFHARKDLVGHVPDAQVFEVREADGPVVGLFVLDLWARPTKNGGAWMTNIVDQSHHEGLLPVVTNNCNYTPGTTTITWDEVITMFHEFGHALHGLLADSQYASRSGANCPRDFVEFPSQVNEHWAWTPGRVLPAEWLDKLKAADAFGKGYETAEAQIAAVLDLVWHTTALEELPESPEDVEAFERAALERYGLYDELVPPRYRSQYFSHIWSNAYSAAYYGYAWAEVMDADAVAWFEAFEGPVREAGEHFRRTLLAPGGSVDPMLSYEQFRGRAPQLQPLLDRLGLSDR